MPNITAKTTSIVPAPELRARLRNADMSSSGAAWRRSQTTKAISETTPMMMPASVSGSDHPFSGPSWMPSTMAPMATADSSEPTTSNGCSVVSREFGTQAMLAARETATSRIGRANVQRHVT